jgi:hypothetical protein
VVKVQNQATLDGSPVAQAIIKFMEDKDQYTAASSELHSKLKGVAAQLGVDVERDKAWPKSARWLWRRIKEVLPLLVAAGVEAHRTEDRNGSIISLRKIYTVDATNTTDGENPIAKGKTRGDTPTDDATADATDWSHATANATQKPADRAERGNSDNSGIRYGVFSEPKSFALEAKASASVEQLRTRRGALTADQEQRVQKLIGEGMA